MKNLLLAFSFVVLNLLTCCDDGDVIVSDENGFDFSNENLRLCHTGFRSPINSNFRPFSVFSNINMDTNEAIAFELPNRIYNDSIGGDPENISITTANPLVYRKFDSNISEDYFCSGIPDNDVGIITELISTRGTVEITTRVIIEADGDTDGDGLTNEDEGYTGNTDNDIDTDNDTFPDYLDSDDDNDNVPTRQELANNEETTTLIPSDFDLDGIPDHRDPDDDNDGVLTRNEISEESNLPRSDRNQNRDDVFFYLDSLTVNNFEATELLNNTSTTTLRTSIILRNFDLGGSIRKEVLSLGSYTITIPENDSIPLTIPETEEMATP